MAGKGSDSLEKALEIIFNGDEMEFVDDGLFMLDRLYKTGKLTKKDLSILKKKIKKAWWITSARRANWKEPPPRELFWWYGGKDPEQAILNDIRYADAYKDWPERDAFLKRKKEEGYII